MPQCLLTCSHALRENDAPVMNASPGTIGTYVGLLRAYQWPKNLIVFGALVFAQQLDQIDQILRSVAAFIVLCASSSAIYILNDLIDVEKDRAHPEKRFRAIASGVVSIPGAAVMTGGLMMGSLVAAFALQPDVPLFCLTIVAFLLLNIAYTFFLKKIMLIDVMAIAIGFVIRGIAGAVVIEVPFSNWLVVCTLFLALFLALGKRRREIGLLEAEAIRHREVLGHYTVSYLDALMLVLAGSTLITYTIYTCSPEVVEKTGTDKLYLTLPFVVYGLFRYLFLVHHKRGGGDPSKTLIRDLPLLATVAGWAFTCVAILYGHKLL